MFTKNFYMQVIPGVDNAFGFGDTEDTYEERQKGTDYTKVGGYGFALGKEKWSLYGWWQDKTVIDREHHQDKVVHDFIMTLPHVRRKDEVFVFDKKKSGLSLDIVKDLITKKFFTEENKETIDLDLRKHQREFVAKSQAEYLKFLLFAKCRAGKTVMALSHVLDRGYDLTLVVSRVSSAKSGWGDDINNFSQFKNFVFIDLQGNTNYKKEIEYWAGTNKQVVLFDTVQGAVKKNIPGVEFIIYDEAHIGASEGAKQWKTVDGKYNCPVLFVTGTAYKMVDDFSDNNTFVYSYFEEQLDKKNGLNDRPSMDLILAKYESAEYQSTFGDDPDSLNNVFRVDDGKFVEPSLVAEFVSRYFEGDRRVRTANRLLTNSNHLYVTLPSVAACYAFAEYLSGTRFSPLVVTGDSKNDPAAINKHLEENPSGAAILTRTANVLGVTARSVDTVINLSQGESIEFWTQFAFRGGSADHNWRVIDFVPDRCLSSLREMFILATDNEPQLTEYEFTDFVNILEWDDKFTTVSHDEVVDIMAKDPRDTRRLLSGLANAMNTDILSDLDFIASLKSSDDNIAVKKNLNENDTAKSSNANRVTNIEKGETSDEAKLISHVKCILERLPIFIINLIQNGDIVDSIASLTSHNEYPAASGDDAQILVRYCNLDRGFAKKLNNRINQLSVDLLSAYNADPIGTLETLSVSDSESRQIPSVLFSDSCPSPQGSDDTLLIAYDPVGLHSTVALSLGWKPQQITVSDENPRHLFSVKAVDAKINLIPESILELDAMQFDVIIGNPPYQAPKGDKKGKGGNNSLYIKFIEKAVELAAPGATISLVTPPAAIIKSTILKKLTPTLDLMVKNGSLDMIDLTTNKHFPGVGCAISRWVYVKGKKQGDVKVITESGDLVLPIDQLFYQTPNPNKVEISIFNKLVNNTEGELLTVVRGKKNQPCTMERFGYPKVQIGGNGVLGFEEKFYEFFTSKLGLWLLDYVRRHDQMIYHNLLTGLVIGDINLTEEETDFINSGNWVNMSRKEG